MCDTFNYNLALFVHFNDSDFGGGQMKVFAYEWSIDGTALLPALFKLGSTIGQVQSSGSMRQSPGAISFLEMMNPKVDMGSLGIVVLTFDPSATSQTHICWIEDKHALVSGFI